VTKMFQRLHDYMVDPQLLVCVLIDEVENYLLFSLFIFAWVFEKICCLQGYCI
jgi:hypothetical protein